MSGKRTEAMKLARLAAEEKCLTLQHLTFEAVSSGIFIKSNGDGKFSTSWVDARLRNNDMKVAKKLIEFSATIN